MSYPAYSYSRSYCTDYISMALFLVFTYYLFLHYALFLACSRMFGRLDYYLRFASLLTSILFLLFLLTSIFISHLNLALFFGVLSLSSVPNLILLPSMLSYDISYLSSVCLHSYSEMIQGICSN